MNHNPQTPPQDPAFQVADLPRRGRPPGTTRPSKPDRKIKTGISMRPDEWTALDALAEKTNLSRGELVAKLVLRQTARH